MQTQVFNKFLDGKVVWFWPSKAAVPGSNPRLGRVRKKNRGKHNG